MLSATEFWESKFDEAVGDSERLAIVMMAEYAYYYHEEKTKESSLDHLGKGLDRIENTVDKILEAK